MILFRDWTCYFISLSYIVNVHAFKLLICLFNMFICRNAIYIC